MRLIQVYYNTDGLAIIIQLIFQREDKKKGLVCRKKEYMFHSGRYFNVRFKVRVKLGVKIAVQIHDCQAAKNTKF